jgi:plasmid stabilization system protein ParE
MVYKIIWTNVGLVSLDKNLDFISKKWNKKIVNDFLSRIDYIIKQIESNPHIFPTSTKFPRYNKVTVHKNVSLFYEVVDSNNVIYIVLVWSNKQNPKKLSSYFR